MHIIDLFQIPVCVIIDLPYMYPWACHIVMQSGSIDIFLVRIGPLLTRLCQDVPMCTCVGILGLCLPPLTPCSRLVRVVIL